MRDRLKRKVSPAGTLLYDWDLAGNLTSIRSPNPGGTSFDYDVGYTWDAANRLASITDNKLGGVSTIPAFTATGRPDTLAQPNGVTGTYVYDNLMDRVNSLSWKLGSGSPFARWDYEYTDRGQRLSSTAKGGRTATDGYDAAARLSSETITGSPLGPSENGTVNYALDAIGNRLSRDSSLSTLASQTFGYDTNDQVIVKRCPW